MFIETFDAEGWKACIFLVNFWRSQSLKETVVKKFYLILKCFIVLDLDCQWLLKVCFIDALGSLSPEVLKVCKLRLHMQSVNYGNSNNSLITFIFRCSWHFVYHLSIFYFPTLQCILVSSKACKCKLVIRLFLI